MAGNPVRNRRGVITCRLCGKIGYKTREEARQARRAIHPAEKMHAYECGDLWHFGHDETWRNRLPDDLRWTPLPPGARAQMNAMAHPGGVS